MFGYLMVAVCLCFGMASCSEDEVGGGTDSAVKVGDKSFSFPYGFWHFNGDNVYEGKRSVSLEFCSWDPLSKEMPSEMSYLFFTFRVPAEMTTLSSIVLHAGEYDMFLVSGMSLGNEGTQYEHKYSDSNNPDLIIEYKDGNYTVKIEDLNIYCDESDDHPTKFSFNYSGKLQNEDLGFN